MKEEFLLGSHLKLKGSVNQGKVEGTETNYHIVFKTTQNYEDLANIEVYNMVVKIQRMIWYLRSLKRKTSSKNVPLRK